MLFGRRLTFAIVILASEALLLALSVAWCIQLIVIAFHGQVCFREDNRALLYGEIAGVALIAILAVIVFAVQFRRLGEKRDGEDRRGKRAD